MTVKTFVTFDFPGTLFNETKSFEVPVRTTVLSELPDAGTHRYGVSPYAFHFDDRRTGLDPDGKPITGEPFNKSPDY